MLVDFKMPIEVKAKVKGVREIVIYHMRIKQISTVSVVFLRALGYCALWVIARSIFVTSIKHLLRALGYYAQVKRFIK